MIPPVDGFSHRETKVFGVLSLADAVVNVSPAPTLLTLTWGSGTGEEGPRPEMPVQSGAGVGVSEQRRGKSASRATTQCDSGAETPA